MIGHASTRWTPSLTTLTVVVILLGVLLTVPLVGLAQDDPPGEPVNIYGTAEDDAGIDVPVGTTIYAVVDGEVEDSITVEDRGEFGGPDPLEDDQLAVNDGAGDEVVFTVNSPDGPEAAETVDLDDADSVEEVALTFPRASFDPESIDVALTTDVLTVENTTQATVTAEYAADELDVTDEANLSVADSDTATVEDDGTVTAVAEGETTITAEFREFTDTAGIEVVSDEPELNDISVTVETTTLEPGAETTATVEAAFTDGSTEDVTDDADITSADSDVVSVAGATLTAEDVGETTITATFEGFEDSVTVTVDEDDEPADDDPAPAPSPPADDDPPTTGDDGPPEDADVVVEETAALETGDDESTAAFTESTVRSVRFDIPVSGSVTTRDLDTAPERDPPGEFVTASQVAVPSGAESVAATLTMTVDQDQLPGDADSLHVFRLVDGDWERLETDVVEETDEAVTIETQTPGFSVFAVSSVESPTAAFDVTPAEPTAGDELTLDASATTPADEITAYEWTVNGQSLTGETVTFTPDEAGDLTVELTVENELEETDTATQTIEVAAVDEDDEPEDDEPEDDEPEDDAVPGFGVAVAALALLSAALLARLRA